MAARRLPAVALAALLAAGAAAPALAEDRPAEPLTGGGLAFSGAPTIQELQAQQRACEVRKPPRKPKGTISESTYKRMERIIDLIGKNQYTEAEQKLNDLSESARGDYEKAIILQTLGFVYVSQDKEAQALKVFESALATNALPQQIHEQLMFNIAQLYIAKDQYDKGMERMNAYLEESCNPLPDAHIMLASIHAEKKQWREALKQVDLALIKARTPKEAWLQFKLATHYELKEFSRCAEVLVYLVALNPIREDYWKQLSSILFEIKRDPDALAVLALAERRGYIDEEAEFRNLANMYMFMQIPYKAGQLLQRGFDQKKIEATEKNLTQLSNAWLAARENDKAEVVLKKAAALSGKGDLYKQLGHIYRERMDWKAALEAFEQAQRKGVQETGDLALLIAQAAIELKQWKKAEDAIRIALNSEKTVKQASEWMAHLQQEYEYATRGKEPEAPAGGDKAAETQTN